MPKLLGSTDLILTFGMVLASMYFNASNSFLNSFCKESKRNGLNTVRTVKQLELLFFFRWKS